MGLIDKITGENYECIALNWDTEYFGVQSARVNLNGIVDDRGQEEIIAFCKKFEFNTISNRGNVKENNRWIGMRTNAYLTDINIQFFKDLSKEMFDVDPEIKVFNLLPRNEEILQISKNAFQYSRFFNDPKLDKSKAANLYLHWTDCAFNQKNKFFVVCKRENQIVGYILFSIDEARCVGTIELVAVDEQTRGQKIGKSLMIGLESFLVQEGVRKIIVGTQVDNFVANHFYRAAGYKMGSCITVYHLWKL